jgi:TPR repeat protein
MKLFKRAADANNPTGMYLYAFGCEKGLWREKNLKEARLYYTQAVFAGYTRLKPAHGIRECHSCVVS